MKYVLFIPAFLLFSLTTFAQDQTLFNGKLESGGFGAPVVKFTSIKGEFGVLAGGYGGWLINHQLLVGLGGYGLVNDIRGTQAAVAEYSRDGRPLYLNFGYGGFVLEYIANPSSLVHLSFNTLIGGGAVNYRNNHFDFEENDFTWEMQDKYDAFFIVEPGIHAEVNMTDWCRAGIGAQYRYVNGIGSLTGVSNKDFSGPSGSITLKFGSF